MKPERLYTARSSYKRLPNHPATVVISPPPLMITPTPSRDSKATSNVRRRLWSVIKVIGPAIVSVAALVIALLAYADQHSLTYTDQHSANTLTENSTQRQQAELVSFLQQQDQSSGQTNTAVLVENNSHAPIYNVVFTVNGELNAFAFTILVYLGDVPPCSSGRITFLAMKDVFGQIFIKRHPGKEVYFKILSTYFTANNGVTWLYTEGNPREQINGNYSAAVRDYSNLPTLPKPQYTQAASCS